ncbi:MAG: permease of the drug/metabolite transporter (DMT) [Erysipelotrichaceae bacterium]|nr:MAG: permease of the drug/metabolite transporter [Erysipelotrichaceae bacterium]TXT19619.1 MAG: permease of the drug/metabolite transporter (DMT) [Erysipelotrichaceae bacterium]
MSITRNSTTGKTALLTSALIWGISFVAVQEALNRGWTPFILLAFRGLLASAAISLVAFRRPFWRNKGLMLYGFLAGVVLFVGFVFQTYGQIYSTVSNASFITVQYVVFIPLLMFRKRKITTSVILGVGLSVIGTGFLTLNDSFSFQLGDVLLVACAVVFALHIVVIEKLAKYNDVMAATLIQVFTVSILGFGISAFTQPVIPTEGWIYVLYAGLFASGLAFLLQIYGQKHVNSTISGILLAFEALFGALGAVLILHEPFSKNTLIGGFLMMCAVFMVELGPRIGVKLKRGDYD